MTTGSKFVRVAAKISSSRFGNVDPIPFRRKARPRVVPPGRKGGKKKKEKKRTAKPSPSLLFLLPNPPVRRALRALNRTDFPYPLGPTDPRPTAVRAEPFSASAFKVLV